MRGTWSVACAACGRPAGDDGAIVCAACGDALVISYDTLPVQLRDDRRRGIWRYHDWLPLQSSATAVSLAEGATPLIRLERWSRGLGLTLLYAKLELTQPTGSFKDRGASVLVSHALALGASRITEDSSGNAGASIAAYAARAGLACTVYAPASTPETKLAQIRAYGAELRTIAGSREAVASAAQAAGRAAGGYYAGHNANPFFVEGCKTLAYELAEEFDGGPDHIILPVGGGSLYCGLALGFAQLRSRGLIRSLPRLHLVQSYGCMPLVAAYEAGADDSLPVVRHRTVAGGIEIERPLRGRFILRALRETGGSAVAVSDQAILDARGALAAVEGVYMEPTSAAAFAGLKRLAAEGVIGTSERVVVVVTGNGLKDPEPGIH